VLAFIDDYKAKNTQLAGGKSDQAEISPVKEVTFSKPQSSPSAPAKPAPGSQSTPSTGKPKTVTY
jgi:hypothetical protein